jgi:tetratricopeptide (TPR) repeat protein
VSQGAGDERRRLLDLIGARLTRFTENRDPEVVLAADAAAEVSALLRVAGDPASDLAVAYAAGWLHWGRYLALGDGDGSQEELEAAVGLLAPIYQVRPQDVPQPLRPLFAAARASRSGQGAQPVRPGRASLERQRLIAKVRGRLQRSEAERDPAAVLDSDALAEVAELMRVAGGPDADPEAAHVAGWLHWVRYQALDPPQDQQDLAAALGLFAPVYQVRPESLPDRVRAHFQSQASGSPEAIAGQASVALQEALRTGDLAVLDRAVELLRQARVAVPEDHPYHLEVLSNLAVALRNRFQGTGRLADVDEAITLLRVASVGQEPAGRPGPAGRPRSAVMLANLGNALLARFERTGDLADLDEAVNAGRAAVSAVSEGDPDGDLALSSLGNILQTRYERTGRLADLDEAVIMGQAAANAVAPGHPKRIAYLSNLGNCLRARYERTGRLADLDGAVEAGRAAVEASAAGDPHRAALLLNYSNALETRGERTGDLASLDEGVEVRRAALAAVPDTHPEHASFLSSLGVALHRRFQRAGRPADLDEALQFSRAAVDATPPDHPERAGRLSNLAIVLDTRLERTDDPAGLDEAVKVSRAAVDATPPDHPERAGRLSGLGAALQARFNRAGDRTNLTDLNEAIEVTRAAVDATPPDHPEGAGWLSNLGNALRTRFDHTGDPADLDEAIDASRRGLAAVAFDHVDRPVCLSSLGGGLKARFERTENLADLDEAIEVMRAAVDAVPLDSPSYGGYLSSLGSMLRARFERTGQRPDLDEAVSFIRAAVDAVPDDHTRRPGWLSELSAALQLRFDRTGRLADLGDAVDASRAAVTASPAGHPGRALALSNLGAALRLRFERTDHLADLDEAIDAGRAAAEASAAGHPGRGVYLSSLGAALQLRFDRAGRLADLDEAIETGRAGVVATVERNPDHASALTNLCRALTVRAWRLGHSADLDEAIETGRAAVAATPPDHRNHGLRQLNLGTALRTRFERTGSLADLDEAIETGRLEVAAISPEEFYRAGYQSGLGTMLRLRFERTGQRADIDEAVEFSRAGLNAVPDDHPDRSGWQDNLSIVLQLRSRLTGDLADLQEAIAAGRAALAAVAADHVLRPGRLSNLAGGLRIRFERTGDMADLDEAIAAIRQAVAASADGDPAYARYLRNLGMTLSQRFGRSEDRSDLDDAIAAFRTAVGVEAAPPTERVEAAHGWGQIAAIGGEWEQAVEGYQAATGLLGLMAERSLARRDQERLLEDRAGLGAEAAACCVNAGLTARAVELFEQGRGILLSQALDSRTDLTDLADRDPELAGRFTALSDELEAVDPGPEAVLLPRLGPGGPGAEGPGIIGVASAGLRAALRETAERRRRLAASLETVIAEVRSVPGFEGFLRPPAVSELARAAAGGAVVVVNVSPFGSHALVLTGDGVHDPVPLPGLTPRGVYDRVVAFLSDLGPALASTVPFGSAQRAAAEQPLLDTLAWLWDEVAEPVLARLGALGLAREGDQWPRVWWCVSGFLSFLPLHAAGYHASRSEPEPRTVIDRVVSSYIPTIRSLSYAQRPRAAPAEAEPGAAAGLKATDRVLVVAMPRTPEADDLPGAGWEAAVISGRLPGQVTVLADAAATYETVLAALPGARWAHFACHGFSSLADPSASRLLLTDHRQRPLTVADVARQRLGDAELACLSACSTAQPGGRLTDEAIHLAAAFQLAGYRQVIGTLWPIGDRHAVEITADLYGTLPATGDAASAVHATVRRMRRRWAGLPSVWASHIQVGA